MKSMQGSSSLALVLYCGSLLGCARDVPAEPPASAWVELSAGLQNGQPERVKKAVFSKDPQVVPLVAELAGWVGDMLRLGNAATKRWGQNVRFFGTLNSSLSAQFTPKDPPTGAASINGDHATVTRASGKTIEFIKVDGRWYLDLDQMGLDYADAAKNLGSNIISESRACMQAVTASIEGPATTAEDAAKGYVKCMQQMGEATERAQQRKGTP